MAAEPKKEERREPKKEFTREKTRVPGKFKREETGGGNCFCTRAGRDRAEDTACTG